MTESFSIISHLADRAVCSNQKQLFRLLLRITVGTVPIVFSVKYFSWNLHIIILNIIEVNVIDSWT